MTVVRGPSGQLLPIRVIAIVVTTIVVMYLTSCGSLVIERAPNGFVVTYTNR